MLKFAKFIGANTDFSTAQAFLFPRVILEGSEDPVFGLVISGEGEDVFVHVRQRILNLEDQFAAPFERVTEKLHSLGEVLISEFSKVERLRFTLFCAKEGTFYVYQHGNDFVEMLRDGESTSIFKEGSLQEKVISGFIKNGDRILVLSAKPGEKNWNREVVEQVLGMPSDDIDDAEAVFAQDELKSQEAEDFAGVKNILPSAFILIENGFSERLVNKQKASGEFESVGLSKPKINFQVKLPSFNFWLFLHRASRRLFALIRRTNKKILMALGILILVGIVGGGGYLFYQSRNSQKNQRVNNLISGIETNLNEASGLKDSDTKLAAEKINQAKTQLSEVQGLAPEDSKVNELKNKVEEKEAEVLKIYKNFNLELFMSLDLIKDNFVSDRMSYSHGELLLLDPNAKSLVAMDTELKTPNILAGSQQLGDAKFASINGSDVYVYSQDRGILHLDVGARRVSSVSNRDEGWGEIKDIFGFSGNVYVLDSGKNMIWKYAPIESGYSQKQEYLKTEANLGLGKELIIDYSVWVLTSEPNILKFTAGGSDFYAMSGLNEPLTQIDGLFVTEELDSVFVLDKSTNRILVTKKNGEYLAQYISPEFSKVTDFFVDEELKLIYLLIDNKIYTTPLR